MGRTLEIEIYGYEYDFYIGQIEGVETKEIEDIHFSEFEEKYPDHTNFDVFSFLALPLFANITIMNNNDIEIEIAINVKLEDIFNIKYKKLGSSCVSC